MSKDFLLPLRKLHGYIHEQKMFLNEQRKIKKKYTALIKSKFGHNPRCVFLVLTPEHDNMGDHAIAYAETRILNSANIDYIEISGQELELLQSYRLLNIMNGSPILINGGGNLGSIWFNIEQLIRDVIIRNPKSSIAILPNTIYYENNDFGKSEFLKSQDIYDHHNNLLLYAREQVSYNIMKSAYKNVKLIPDVVLSLDMSDNKIDRDGCLLCLRHDREKTLTDMDEDIIIRQVERMFGNNYTRTDTCIGVYISKDNRGVELSKKIQQFKSAELVITDRLHGMIFAAITGTPCILIDSKSPKIKGCYEWLKTLEYIHFVNDISQINDIYKSIPKREYNYNNEHLKPYFDILIQDISNILEGI